MNFFIDSILFSYSQIFFSNRKWFGALLFAASMVIPTIGLMALFGVILSNLTAVWLRFDKEKIRTGFYGFNGILFGAASTFYFDLNLFLLLIIPIFIIITFFIASVLENYLAVAFNLPGLSLPFVLSIYIFIIFLANYNSLTGSNFYSVTHDHFFSLPELVKNYFHSAALILFQPSIISGFLIVLALLIFSRVLFSLSIIAFLLNAIFLNLLLPNLSDNLIVLTGFNSILTAFALGGVLIIPSRKSFLLVVVSSLMVIITTGFFIQLLSSTNLPLLVLPFNFIVLLTIYSLKFRKDQTDLVLLYFKPGSPEENFYFHQKNRSRFEKFKFLFPELPFFGEWFISQGFNGKFTHKDEWKYAWDFVVADNNQVQFSDEGSSLTDYYCYKLPVSSPLDGEVVKVIDGIPANKIGDINLEQNWGNTIILKHEYDLFSSVSHLEAGSIKVKEGDKVKKGELIAQCGNSGRSPIPHIHFQFQATDKLGDKTYKFPFAHFLEKQKDKYFLRTFDYPEEGKFIQNIEIHKTIKQAFDFKFGDKLNFKCSLNNNIFDEEWEVKINMNNELFLENNKGDKAILFSTKKVFYFTNYIGKRNSALYFFYLSATQVPLCFQNNLFWTDHYSAADFDNNLIRYFSEFFLMFKGFISATGEFNFTEPEEQKEGYIIHNNILVKGESLFSFYKRNLQTSAYINYDGLVEELKITGDKINFTARIIN